MYKALVTFSGVLSMVVGDTREIADTALAKDLLRAGYIEEISPARKAKAEPKEETTEAKPKKRTTKK